MIRLINRYTGTEMLVADDRLDEYIRAGHKLALPDEKPAEAKEPKKKAPKKK